MPVRGSRCGPGGVAPWSVVLSGGEGTRLSPLIRLWRGEHIPKQYCAFSGRRSMLEHTLRRAAPLFPKSQTLTVISRGHRRHLTPALAAACGRLIEQPEGRDTAPGILLPAAHVLREDPDGTIVIFPSDHFIDPPDAYLDHVESAIALARRFSDKLVLLGAVPEGPEEEFGWVTPGPEIRCREDLSALTVTGFVEKPVRRRANHLFKAGGLWNTFIMAVRARTLWEMTRAQLPEIVADFDRLTGALGTRRETDIMETVFARIPKANFSKDVLQKEPGRILMVPMRGVAWSDWGRPARIVETLDELGRRPAFPVGLLRRAEALA